MFLEDPRALKYPLREQHAILDHFKSLIEAPGSELTIQEVILRWEANPGPVWRDEVARCDGADQVTEIQRHKWIESEKHGYDVGEQKAAYDWVLHYAGVWRAHRERSPRARP